MSHVYTPADGGWQDVNRIGMSSHYSSTVQQAISPGGGTYTLIDFDTEITDTLNKGSITTGASFRYTSNESQNILVNWGLLTVSLNWNYANSYMATRLFLNGNEIGPRMSAANWTNWHIGSNGGKWQHVTKCCFRRLCRCQGYTFRCYR